MVGVYPLVISAHTPSTRFLLVSGFVTEIVQQIQSLPARGVRLFRMHVPWKPKLSF